MSYDPQDAMKARWNHIQGSLFFPWLREEVAQLTGALGRLVTTLDVIGLEAFVSVAAARPPPPTRGAARPSGSLGESDGQDRSEIGHSSVAILVDKPRSFERPPKIDISAQGNRNSLTGRILCSSEQLITSTGDDLSHNEKMRRVRQCEALQFLREVALFHLRVLGCLLDSP